MPDNSNFGVRWPGAAARGQLGGGVGFSTEPARLAHFGARCLVTGLFGVALHVLLVRLRERISPAKV
jgi:hypothetical protein